MATAMVIDDLRRSPTEALVEGGGDDLPVSVFVTAYARGQGADL